MALCKDCKFYRLVVYDLGFSLNYCMHDQNSSKTTNQVTGEVTVYNPLIIQNGLNKNMDCPLFEQKQIVPKQEKPFWKIWG